MSSSDIDLSTHARNGHHRPDTATPSALDLGLQSIGVAPIWHASAPNKLKHLAADGDRAGAWHAWSKYLLQQQRLAKLRNRLRVRADSSLTWGLADDVVNTVLIDSVIKIKQSDSWQEHVADEAFRDQATDKLGLRPAAADASQTSLKLSAAIGSISIAQRLSQPGLDAEPDSWWQQLEALVQIVQSAAAITLDQSPLEHQLLRGELALTLAYLFSEVTACRVLLPTGRAALSAGLNELLDGEGMPHRHILADHQPLVACWTRCRAIGAAMRDCEEFADDGSLACWDSDAEAQYPLAVRKVLRLARRDGRSPLSTTPIESRPDKATRRFFEAMVRQSDDAAVDEVWEKLTKHWRSKPNPARSADSELWPGEHSEWSQIALLRVDWKPTSPRMLVQYGEQQVTTEFSIGRDLLFTGRWEYTATVDGQVAQPTGDWEEVCWVSDEDVDYLEIELNLTDGLRIQRQICLAREDRFLFMADALLGTQSRSLQYRMKLPLGSGISTLTASETRELFIGGNKPRGLVLPLALPEWQSDSRGGRLTADETGLQLEQHITGTSLFAPVWIDLDPKRVQREYTWRQLHVAEQRQNVTRDVAAGFRIQMGKAQWLVYRALGRAANRTVLGHNLATDFLIARFARTGEVSTLIEVE